MRVLLILALVSTSSAFTLPRRSALVGPRRLEKSTRLAALDGSVDPSWLLHVVNGLADGDVADGAAAAAAAAVDTVAADDGGWFGAFVDLIELAIRGCDGFLVSATGAASFGASIVLFTLFVKALTFPLLYTQLKSTTKMQAIQPKVKQLQAMYASNPEIMNREMAALYSENEVNPLAGCLPSLVQLPLFIGLYRALLKLAKDNYLDEPFLWLPNLEGPVYGATNSDWLFKGWVDGAPSLGWEDTLAFLTLPIILILVQSLSQKVLQPPPNPNQDESQAASQEILKYLPIMFGFFALNVPSGLGVYWVINSLVSTAATVFIKNQVNAEMEAAGISMPTPAAPAGPAPTAATSFSSMVDAEVVSEASMSSEPFLPPVEGFASSADPDDPFGPKKTKKKKKSGKKRK